MKTTYSKKDKLKGKKQIDHLFERGKSVSVFPLSAVYMSLPNNDGVLVKAGVSVGKRKFKKATDRNRIKRLLREGYRLNKNDYFNNITTQCALMILYIGNEMPSFEQVDVSMKQLLNKLSRLISE